MTGMNDSTLIVDYYNDECNVMDDNAIDDDDDDDDDGDGDDDDDDDDTAKGGRPVVTWLVMTYHGAEVETTLICLNNNTLCFDKGP